jgi:hypothetical protein
MPAGRGARVSSQARHGFVTGMMCVVTRPATAAPTQRVCPHCARIAHTNDRRCPFCRRPYRRHVLLWIAVMLAVFAAVVLGGVAALLVVAGDRTRDELDDRVTTVQRDFDRSVTSIEDNIRQELDQRLGSQGATTP